MRFLVSCLMLLVSGLFSETSAQFSPPLPIVQQNGTHPVFGELCSIPPAPPAPCRIVQRYARIQQALAGIFLPPIGPGPYGPVCNGPLGTGPCDQVRHYLAMLQVGREEFNLQPISYDPNFGPICAGPLGPGSCDSVIVYLIQTDGGGAPIPNFDPRQVQAQGQGPAGVPMCSGPAGNMPCNVLAQLGLDRMGGAFPSQASFGVQDSLEPKQLAAECAQRSGLDVATFSACVGKQIILPASQQRVLDCAVSNTSAEDFGKCAAPELGIRLSDEQRALVGCAKQSEGNAANFAACVGGGLLDANLGEREQAIIACAAGASEELFVDCVAPQLLQRDQQAVLKCAVDSGDVEDFASCAAPRIGVKMSDDQRVLVRCAAQADGDETSFLTCAGTAFAGRNLGPNEHAVLNCAANSGGDAGDFASCAASGLLGAEMSAEQKIALKCAAQSQGDPVGMATCAGANMFGMQLNPEQQIAVQCVVSTGGQPHAAAGCMASRLTARELTKCLSQGIGGKGCFGDTNDLVGKDGWLRRNMGAIAGGPNSVINSPDQIWGGDNSFVRNPHQVFGGRNSFFRNPDQIWGGPNSVFNRPEQLLPQPKPVQIGTIGGKRICLPWC